MASRRRIGVVFSMNGSPYQGNFLKGFCSETVKYDYDVLVFSAVSKRGMAERFVNGEINIYSLMNYDILDGIVILPDTLPHSMDERNKLLDSLYSDNKKPVVCIDYDDSRFANINTMDEKGMERVTDHMIEEHDCRDIVFVGGPKDHPHTVMRENGYINSLNKHGIEVKHENIMYGSFWYDTGNMIKDSLRKRGRLPDAIVCANDPMALSVINMLESEGIKIPDDINIAGYDNEDDGTVENECVTSCTRDVYSTGVRAAYKILEILGTEVNKTEIPDMTKLVVEQTCKCFMKNYSCHSYRPKGSDAVFTGFENVHSEYNFMQEDMISNNSLEEYLWNADWYMKALEPFNAVSVFLNDNIFSTDENTDTNSTGYTDMMRYVFSRNCINGSKFVEENNRYYKKEKLVPELYEDRDEAAVFYFIPFHYYERCFGYVVLQFSAEDCICNPNVNKLMRNMNISFESLRRHLIYQKAHESEKKLFTENMLLNNDLLQTQEQLIIAFAEITESKSGQTGQHVKRVSEYSKVLGEALGLCRDDVEILRMASMMHDIGKLSIPEEILEKPGKLTAEEFDIIKTHVTEGERLLKNSPGKIMKAARIIALEHHEKWNGKGYLGKSGEEIDFMSTIVAVADVYDALVSRRSYKEPFPHEEAYRIILADRGQHFSPVVVDAFASNYDKIVEVLRRHPDKENS